MRLTDFPITVLFVSVTAALLEQAIPRDPTIRLSLESELRDTLGGEAEAHSMIESAIVERFAGRAPRPAVVNVIAEQFPERWLPRIEGVRFERLALVQAQDGWRADCLRLFWLTATVSEKTLTLGVSEGDWCHSSGTFGRFERTAMGWNSLKEGGGFGGFAGACPCSK